MGLLLVPHKWLTFGPTSQLYALGPSPPITPIHSRPPPQHNTQCHLNTDKQQHQTNQHEAQYCFNTHSHTIQTYMSTLTQSDAHSLCPSTASPQHHMTRLERGRMTIDELDDSSLTIQDTDRRRAAADASATPTVDQATHRQPALTRNMLNNC